LEIRSERGPRRKVTESNDENTVTHNWRPSGRKPTAKQQETVEKMTE